ncbi:HDOD domain-containing protein [Amphritea pacifica]|uniref:HDOD domain-containing protein n=1 Tax=Amphritea pacifica TaxID=2811233 RepID=A0ABS2WCR1_9GAMM|nr:HDOD domain-containing protein [Amphritea pacifica]MBN0989415.1 HDOD domain-containing protein [Amphritea pacifica]MBN1006915.1 HDOD domain-containing protein [Amphritea pacifica]
MSANITPHGTREWVERISEHELPALCSTIREIEKISKDDTSSLARLGQAILHDHALTTAVLKVANSAGYMGHNPVTTVSRASVVLGLTRIKNICITAKMLNSLLKNRKLTPGVYERLLKLMAQSFHAGMIAKMMMQDYEDDVQEEAFIAALLNRFGESAFWSMGGPVTAELDKQLRQKQCVRHDDIAYIVRQKLGTSFEEMSLGLASSWNMGSVLISTLEEPELRTPELRCVSLAVKVSEVLATPHYSRNELDKLLTGMADLTQWDKRDLMARVEQCSAETVELLRTYGAGVLTRYIRHDLATQVHGDSGPVVEPLSDQALQLRILRELAFLPNENADFNLVVQTALEGIHRGIRMRRTIVFLKSRERGCLMPRFISAVNFNQIKREFVVSLGGSPNIFTHVLNSRQPVWVENLNVPKWRAYLDSSLRQQVSSDGFFIAPIIWGRHCVGLFYADRNESAGNAAQRQLSEDDFMAFTLFAQQTNICFSLILKNAE